MNQASKQSANPSCGVSFDNIDEADVAKEAFKVAHAIMEEMNPGGCLDATDLIYRKVECFTDAFVRSFDSIWNALCDLEGDGVAGCVDLESEVVPKPQPETETKPDVVEPATEYIELDSDPSTIKIFLKECVRRIRNDDGSCPSSSMSVAVDHIHRAVTAINEHIRTS